MNAAKWLVQWPKLSFSEDSVLAQAWLSSRTSMAARGRVFSRLAIGFALNLVWENGQWPFYRCSRERSWCRIPMTIRASAADALLIFAMHEIGSILFDDTAWSENMDARKVTFSVTTGAVAGIFLEHCALQFGAWNYCFRMPRLPGSSIGLLPVLQMALLPSLTFWLAASSKA